MNAFSACGDFCAFALKFLFTSGTSLPDDWSEDRFDEVVAEVGGEAVFQPPAAGAVLEEPLKVSLVGAQAEGQLARRKPRMGVEIGFDVPRHPLAPGLGFVAIFLSDPALRLSH